MPAIAALYAALVVLLLLVLAIPISRLRRSRGIGLGDGGDRELARAIRVHANLLEWGLPAIVLLLVAELTRAPVVLLHGCGIVLLVGRGLHALGLSRSGGVLVRPLRRHGAHVGRAAGAGRLEPVGVPARRVALGGLQQKKLSAPSRPQWSSVCVARARTTGLAR